MTKRRHYTEAEIALIRRLFANTETSHIAYLLGRSRMSVDHKAMKLGLRKSPEHLAKVIAATTQTAIAAGKASRFKPGLVPWNKGKSIEVCEAAKAKQFKPGNRPHTWLPIGALRVVDGDILERKVADVPGPPGNRWKPVTRLVWEAAHGPVPEGYVVAFRDGKRTTKVEEITLDRLECVSRAEMARRNSIHNLPPQLADLARLRGKLTRAIHQVEKGLKP